MRIEAIGCLVTGASAGIGRAVARELVSRRCRVALLARREAPLAELRDVLVARGGTVEAFPADVTETVALRRAVNAADAWCGGLRLVVANAGVGVHGSTELLADERLRSVVDVNLVGALATVRAVLPHLRRSAPSSLVAVASLSGLIPYRGGGAYGGSKAALIAALRCLRLEVAGEGIRVGWLCPGPVRTAMIEEGVPVQRLPRLARLTIPVLSPERVAREVVRLAGGRGGQRVIPLTAAFFAAFARHFPRAAERVELATGAGDP